MSEILNLAEKFKEKSDKQAKSIEREIQSVTNKLTESMTQSLSESENIIKQGTASLEKMNEQLEQMIKESQTHNQDMLKTCIRQHQTLMKQGLDQNMQETKELVTAYSAATLEITKKYEDQIYQAIKSKITIWLIGAGLIAFMILAIGIFTGVYIAKINSQQVILYTDYDPHSQTYGKPQVISQQ